MRSPHAHDVEDAVVGNRHPNYRLAKIHHNYTVEEVARLFAVHRNTVRAWVKHGLTTTDRRRPLLILGRDLRAFLQARRLKNKRTCQPGEIYCVRCREPRSPTGDTAEYRPFTRTSGNLVGVCPCCANLIFRRVNVLKLDQVRGKLDITMPQAQSHISESACPSVNSDLREDQPDHAHAQPQ